MKKISKDFDADSNETVHEYEDANDNMIRVFHDHDLSTFDFCCYYVTDPTGGYDGEPLRGGHGDGEKYPTLATAYRAARKMMADIIKGVPTMYRMKNTENNTGDATMSKTITVDTIKDRDSKRFGLHVEGRVLEGVSADVTPKKSIRLYGTQKRTRWNGETQTRETFDLEFSNTFAIGDLAEYDSYNLSYYGKIISITAKTVTIEERHKNYDAEHGKRHRLNLYQFAWRNWNFDADEAFEKNAETSMYI